MTALRVDDGLVDQVIDPGVNPVELLLNGDELPPTALDLREQLPAERPVAPAMHGFALSIEPIVEAFEGLVRQAVEAVLETRARIMVEALSLTDPDRRDLVYERMGPVARREWGQIAAALVPVDMSDWSLACRLPEQRRSRTT